MWLQRFTNYILRHRLLAILLTFVSTFIPIIGIVGILIATLITLCRGIAEGAIFTIAATLPYIVTFFISSHHPQTMSLIIWAAVGVAVLSNLLTWVFAVMLQRQSSWSVILQVAALLGVLVISIIHLVYPNVAIWWGNELLSYYKQGVAVTGAIKGVAAPTSEMQLEAINISKQYATGLMVSAILFNAVLQLMVARWWQAIVFKPGSLRRELHRIRLSYLAGILFVLSLILSYLGNSVVLDIMPVLYMLFAAAGLSLIHYLFGLMHSHTAWFWLAVLYLTLLFALPTSVVLVAIIALVDIWFDVRKRFRKA